jgi:hypothetical protein
MAAAFKPFPFALFMLALASAAPALAATAADPEQIGVYGDWTAYRFNDARGAVCFMSSAPKKQTASVKNIKRGDAAFFITNWAGEGNKNVVSVTMGYPLKEGSQVTASVDGKAYTLATNMSPKADEAEIAWTKDAATDAALATAVSKGSNLTVKGTSRRGTLTTDNYSLKGSGDAFKAIAKACGS